MKAICFLLLALSVAFASEFTYDEGVLVLTTSNFAKALEEFDFALVEFYAPWCGHCKSLAPEYAKAAQALAESHPNVKLCKVDATVENDLAEKFEIGGFPTLKFFRKGHTEPADYNGGRTSGDIINWLKKRTGDIVAAVNSVEEVEKQVADNDAVVLFLGNTASEVYTNFLQTAALFDEVTFIHTDNAEVRQKYEGSENGLIIFADSGAEKKVYSGDNSVESFKTFVNTHRFPLVLPFNQNAAQKIFGEELDAIFLIISNNDAGKQAKAVFRTVAEELQNKIAFSVADIGEDLGGRLAEFVGVSEGDLPAIRIAQPSAGMKKFVLDQEITVDNIKKFIGDFLDGKLEPHFKSEAIPASSHDGNVRVVVGKNFKEVVLDETKDVLLELYAPWCGHCKQLVPIYESLAAKLRSYNDIVIAKMDATANEVEGLEIEGFPTIRLYPKNKKDTPIEFDGDRSEDGFIDFLKQNGSVTIDIQTGGSSSHDHSHHDHDHAHHDHDHAHHDHDHAHHDHGHEKHVVQDEL